VEAVLRRLTARLLARAGDAASARLEAEVLLAHALGTTRAGLLVRRAVSSPEACAAEALVARRVDGAEPVAYLLGRRGFRELELAVDRRVLVPRPETELVVEVLLALHASGALPAGALADRGTGSGNIALSVCGLRPVIASDLSADALAVAAANLAAAGAACRVLLVHADGLGHVRPASLAAVLANPPYVEAHEHALLPDDVRLHEPRLALVPGEGSAEAMYARLVRESAEVLVRGGWLVTEVGAGQAPRVAALARAAGFEPIAVHRDLAGIERVVAARRS
jgi:release factor glutamine methyltransferase